MSKSKITGYFKQIPSSSKKVRVRLMEVKTPGTVTKLNEDGFGDCNSYSTLILLFVILEVQITY